MPGLRIGKVSGLAGSSAISVPISFESKGAAVSAMLFSIDFDEQCLNYRLGNARFNLPPGFVPGIAYDATDKDGEIDITISDYVPPMNALPDRVLVTLTFGVTCAPTPPATTRVAAVAFAASPPPSFGNPLGGDIAGWVQSGAVVVQATPPPVPANDVYLPAVRKP